MCKRGTLVCGFFTALLFLFGHTMLSAQAVQGSGSGMNAIRYAGWIITAILYLFFLVRFFQRLIVLIIILIITSPFWILPILSNLSERKGPVGTISVILMCLIVLAMIISLIINRKKKDPEKSYVDISTKQVRMENRCIYCKGSTYGTLTREKVIHEKEKTIIREYPFPAHYECYNRWLKIRKICYLILPIAAGLLFIFSTVWTIIFHDKTSRMDDLALVNLLIIGLLMIIAYIGSSTVRRIENYVETH